MVELFLLVFSCVAAAVITIAATIVNYILDLHRQLKLLEARIIEIEDRAAQPDLSESILRDPDSFKMFQESIADIRAGRLIDHDDLVNTAQPDLSESIQ